MKGDISLPDLGLSQEDRNLLLEKVNVVFHVAATEIQRAVTRSC